MNQKFLYIEGRAVPVSDEVYQAFWHYKNKEDYFMRQLKAPRYRLDRQTQAQVRVPARECSLEQLTAAGQQFLSSDPSVEELVLSGIWLEELLKTLTAEEQGIIWHFYIQGKSERAACAALGIPKTTFRRHEQRLRVKLGVLLKKYL